MVKLQNDYVTKDYFKKELKKAFKKELGLFRQSIRLDMNDKINDLKAELEEKDKKRQSETLNRLNEILGEVRSSRQERIIMGKQVANHEQRLEKIEETVFVH